MNSIILFLLGFGYVTFLYKVLPKIYRQTERNRQMRKLSLEMKKEKENDTGKL